MSISYNFVFKLLSLGLLHTISLLYIKIFVNIYFINSFYKKCIHFI